MPSGEKKENKWLTSWRRLFPGFLGGNQGDSANVVIPPISGYEDFTSDAILRGGVADSSGEEDTPQEITDFPEDRLLKYGILRTMSKDPTIDSAIKMHISHALSAKSDTGEIISIESATDKDDPITIDLRNTLKKIVNENCQFWAYNAALNGVCYARVYGESRKGISLVRSDYYTHPKFIREYEQAGQIAGYTASYQNPNQSAGRIPLMEPWKFAAFKIPISKVDAALEPQRLDGRIFDIASDDYTNEAIVETQNYGTSLIETAFGPWFDLNEAILSLKMSRKNAARLERLIGVNTGRLSPTRAAQYLNTVSSQIQKTGKAKADQALRRGFIQTVVNHIIPIFGDGKGRLDISSLEGDPNIDGLSDVDFHIKRLGSAIGIDPSLLGFGEMLSGGLGDGGFFRISILAAIKAALLRRAILEGIEALCDIHVAYKYNKVFLPGEKPWRIVFNSISTALEREERENREGQVNFAMMVAQLIQLIDPEFQATDRNVLANMLFTDVMKFDEEKIKTLFSKKIEDQPPEGGNPEADNITESIFSHGPDVRRIIDRCFNDIYEGR
jgi:hypothetical protein